MNVKMCTVIYRFASAPGGLRPWTAYQDFTRGLHWGTSVPQNPSFIPFGKFLDPPPMDRTGGTATGPRVGEGVPPRVLKARTAA